MMPPKNTGPWSFPRVVQRKTKASSSKTIPSKVLVATAILSACTSGCILLTLRLHGALNDVNTAAIHNHNNRNHFNDNHSKSKSNSNSTGLSACLLVNDENPRLPEWLAYHYRVLPLRSRVLAVDPASRSSPLPVVRSFSRTLPDLRIDVWAAEDAYLPPGQPRGACDADNSRQACLWTHRNRQQHFVARCLATFKRRGATWVLLLDADEYAAFNPARDDEPPAPMDEPPDGVAALRDWRVMHGKIRGKKRAQLVGLIEGGGTKNGTYVVTGAIREADEDIVFGNVVRDDRGERYFLRDDSTKYQDPDRVMSRAPDGVPTLKGVQVRGSKLYATIYNDTYGEPHRADGEYTHIRLHPKLKRELLKSGNVIQDAQGKKYFIENEQLLWPPHVKASEALRARRELPALSDGTTILDVLRRYQRRFDFGACLQMPRLLYGSKESGDFTPMAPNGFRDEDFVTLRYRWHARKGDFDVNKFQKTMIDVSRVPMDHLEGKQAYNIHRPLEYFCRADVPRFATSLFRVNHYLDSYEAYTYRNDARGNKRKGCMECYLKKGNGTDFAADDDIRPWLRGFVEEVGREKAEILLAGVGDFRPLGEGGNHRQRK